jgi:hypothetical protein
MNDCSHPLLLDEEDLLRYVLDDEPLSPEALEHVNQCSPCQGRLSRYKQINTYLLKNIYRSTCPSPTLLNHYVAQLLIPEEAIAIDHHLNICPLCIQEVQDTRLLIANFDPFPEHSFPEGKTLERITAFPVSGLYQESAEKLFSEWENRPWHGQYQVSDLLISLYSSQTIQGDYNLSAHITFVRPSEDTSYLQNAPAELCRVYVRENEPAASSEEVYLLTQIDAAGNLQFEHVLEGTYTLFLHLPMTEIVIEDLPLKKAS